MDDSREIGDKSSPSPSPTSLPGISALESGFMNEEIKNPNEINWASENDQLNPMNWPTAKKWLNLGVISAMTLSTYALQPISCLPFSEDRSN